MTAGFWTRNRTRLMSRKAWSVCPLAGIAMVGKWGVMGGVAMTEIQVSMAISMSKTVSMAMPMAAFSVMASMQKAHRDHHSEANCSEPKENLVDEHGFINATRFWVLRLRDFAR